MDNKELVAATLAAAVYAKSHHKKALEDKDKPHHMEWEQFHKVNLDSEIEKSIYIFNQILEKLSA